MVYYILKLEMGSMVSLAGITLVVAGALAFWYLNKSEPENKREEKENSEVEDSTIQEV